MNFEKALKKVKDIVWKWQFSEKREAFIQVIVAAQKQIPKLAKVSVVPQYIEGREMPKLVSVDVRCPECDSIVSIRDNYCSEFKHTCHYERIGVYFKETESISTNLVVVYVIEVLNCCVCGNMVEDILTKSVYKVDKEREDLENYICSLTKNKIPSELEYKLKNTGKYLHGQYNFIK